MKLKLGDEVRVSFGLGGEPRVRGPRVRVVAIHNSDKVQVEYPDGIRWWYGEASLELVNGLDLMLEIL